MKRSRFTDSQILAILKQNEAGTPVTELCREHGMSDATFYIYGLPPYCKH
jgi:putative transposase